MQQALAKLRLWYRLLFRKHLRQSPQVPAVIYPDDTFIVSYPRSGSAWIRRLISVMQDPLREPSVKNIDSYVPDIYSVGARLDSYKRPRIMKSHETYHPGYPRVIYLVRDGRDVAVSYYSFYQTLYGQTESFKHFLKRFLDGELRFGSWQEHVRSWVFRNNNNLFMVLQYEQLHESPCSILHQTADFLNFDADDARIRLALKKCTFEILQEDIKRNTTLSTKGYVGGVKGAPGAWKETFTNELADLFWQKAGETMKRLGYRHHEGRNGSECLRNEDSILSSPD